MTIDYFLRKNNITKKTFNKRFLHGDIKGVMLLDGNIIIPAGTRYPYNLGNTKILTRDQKRCALLKATDMDKYIDHIMLKMDIDQFMSLLDELVNEGLLKDNGNNNLYGANRYDTTRRYAETVHEMAYRKKKEKAELAGTLLGAGVSQIIRRLD